MSKEKHVILRSNRSTTRDIFLGPVSAAGMEEAASAGMAVEVDDLERRDLASMSRDATVVAMAPVVPMKLVEPVEVEQTAQPAAEEVTWGVRTVRADSSPFSGDGVVVAVLDTGIDAAHEAFEGVALMKKDFTGEGVSDQHGHGTHCAGTIFGRKTGGMRIGVAPGVRKALIGKVLGSRGGASDDIVRAIQWASENGANVVSMSLGIDFPGLVKRLEERGFPTELATSRALEGYRANVQLFERLASLIRAQGAFSQAMIIVAAAGNESRRDENPDFEIATSPPAVSEGVISVGALGQGSDGLSVARFSNTGPNLSGPGVRVVSARLGGGLATMSGTSMATPHVAGVAALWAEKILREGSLSAFSLTGRLAGTATTSGLAAGFDPFDVGVGLVQAPQT